MTHDQGNAMSINIIDKYQRIKLFITSNSILGAISVCNITVERPW